MHLHDLACILDAIFTVVTYPATGRSVKASWKKGASLHGPKTIKSKFRGTEKAVSCILVSGIQDSIFLNHQYLSNWHKLVIIVLQPWRQTVLELLLVDTADHEIWGIKPRRTKKGKMGTYHVGNYHWMETGVMVEPIKMGTRVTEPINMRNTVKKR